MNTLKEDTWKCKKCGCNNDYKYKSCGNCGKKLQRICRILKWSNKIIKETK